MKTTLTEEEMLEEECEDYCNMQKFELEQEIEKLKEELYQIKARNRQAIRHERKLERLQSMICDTLHSHRQEALNAKIQLMDTAYRLKLARAILHGDENGE